jgi:hypothetical protein
MKIWRRLIGTIVEAMIGTGTWMSRTHTMTDHCAQLFMYLSVLYRIQRDSPLPIVRSRLSQFPIVSVGPEWGPTAQTTVAGTSRHLLRRQDVPLGCFAVAVVGVGGRREMASEETPEKQGHEPWVSAGHYPRVPTHSSISFSSQTS